MKGFGCEVIQSSFVIFWTWPKIKIFYEKEGVAKHSNGDFEIAAMHLLQNSVEGWGKSDTEPAFFGCLVTQK